jgi:hypothetical protein
MLLLADMACDWCSKPLPPEEQGSRLRNGSAAPAGGSSSGSSSTSQQIVRGCPSCGAAQYCSKACADTAKEVHTTNCW